MKRLDLILILAIGALVVFVLWKSGIFKLTSKASDTANKVLDTADTVVSGVADLPGNVATLVGEIPDVIRTVGQDLGLNTFEVAEPTERAQTIVNEMARLYPNLDPMTRIQQVHLDGITFDNSGLAMKNGVYV